MSTWIDITRPMNDEMVCWPGRTPPQRTWDKNIDRGDHCNASSWQLSAHTGTHMDAPLHFCQSGRSIDEISPDVFHGECVVVDLSALEVPVFDVDLATDVAGAKRVLIRSSHSKPDRRNAYNPHDALLTPAAADCLLEGGLQLLGTDRLSVDDARGDDFTLHHRLLCNDCVIIEGLRLADVPAGKYVLYAAPLAMTGAEASPVRALLCTRDP